MEDVFSTEGPSSEISDATLCPTNRKRRQNSTVSETNCSVFTGHINSAVLTEVSLMTENGWFFPIITLQQVSIKIVYLRIVVLECLIFFLNAVSVVYFRFQGFWVLFF